MTTTNDLNVLLARLMGWDYEQTSDEMSDEPLYRIVMPDGNPLNDSRWWVSREYANHAIPPFSRSLDALFAPGGPVEYATKRGWGIELTIEAGNESDNWNAWATHNAIDAAHAYGPRPAEALATALHEAFMKEQGQ